LNDNEYQLVKDGIKHRLNCNVTRKQLTFYSSLFYQGLVIKETFGDATALEFYEDVLRYTLTDSEVNVIGKSYEMAFAGIVASLEKSNKESAKAKNKSKESFKLPFRQSINEVDKDYQDRLIVRVDEKYGDGEKFLQDLKDKDYESMNFLTLRSKWKYNKTSKDSEAEPEHTEKSTETHQKSENSKDLDLDKLSDRKPFNEWLQYAKSGDVCISIGNKKLEKIGNLFFIDDKRQEDDYYFYKKLYVGLNYVNELSEFKDDFREKSGQGKIFQFRGRNFTFMGQGLRARLPDGSFETMKQMDTDLFWYDKFIDNLNK